MGQWSGPHKARTHDVTGARTMREHRALKRVMAEERNAATPEYRRRKYRLGHTIDRDLTICSEHLTRDPACIRCNITITNGWEQLVNDLANIPPSPLVANQRTAAEVSKRGMRKRRRPGTATPVAEATTAHNATTVTTTGDYL